MSRNPINIRLEIGEAACWEQLAQECIRLADAALLQAKILRQDNPTPKAAMDIDGILEGVAAVYACEEIIGLTESMELMHFSYMERWQQRIKRNR